MSTPERLADWQLPEGVDRALWDYVTRPEIASEYDGLFADTPLLQRDEQFLLDHAPPATADRPTRLVDLGCGSGRTLLATGQRGWQGVGVDLSAPMLAVAKSKLAAAGLSMPLVEANLCALPIGTPPLEPASFDVACCLFATLGMIRGSAQRQQVLVDAARLLRPGGVLVLHVHNWWSQIYHPTGRSWLLADVGRRLSRSPEAGDCVQPAYRGIPHLTMHLFTRGEIRSLLRRAGLSPFVWRAVGVVDQVDLPRPWFLPGLRAVGWLVAARIR